MPNSCILETVVRHLHGVAGMLVRIVLVGFVPGFALLTHHPSFFGHRVGNDLQASLGGIAKKSGDLIFGPPHVGHLWMIPMEVDGIEFASGGAKSAADALIRIDDGSAAGEASSRLLLHLLFGHSEVSILEGVLIIDLLIHSDLGSASVIVIIDDDVALIEGDEVPSVSSKHLRDVVGAHVSDQGFSGLMPLGDGIDDEFRTGIDVASDEDVWIGGLIGVFVSDRIVAMPEGDVGAF